MSESIGIKVFEVVGSKLCVASSDGQKVHDQIAAVLNAGKQVQLSFANVESLTSAFLNAAIGQLYAEFSEQKIRANLSVSSMTRDDVELLKGSLKQRSSISRILIKLKKSSGKLWGSEHESSADREVPVCGKGQSLDGRKHLDIPLLPAWRPGCLSAEGVFGCVQEHSRSREQDLC